MGSLVGIDTLVGIDNCYKEKIFDAFEQVGNKKRHVKGTGLGLAFVKQVVELHGGNVSVVSKVDKGSFFAIDLPISSCKLCPTSTNILDLQQSNYHKAIESQISAPCSRLSLVLLIGKNNATMNSFFSYLEAKRHRLIWAISCQQAIEHVDLSPPD